MPAQKEPTTSLPFRIDLQIYKQINRDAVFDVPIGT